MRFVDDVIFYIIKKVFSLGRESRENCIGIGVLGGEGRMINFWLKKIYF